MRTVGLLSGIVFSHLAFCQVATNTPMLRIEAGSHTATISGAATDSSETYLVTGSVDKTLRLWALASGELLRVIRPPIGDGNEGLIATVALSPDAQTIACGGWTAHEADETNSIYLFDRSTGRLLRRLQGLPNTILHLAFSPDGRWLVATLGKNPNIPQRIEGIRLYRTTDWAIVGSDTNYGGSSNWADFVPGVAGAGGDTKLVTTAEDGLIRLYRVGAQGSLSMMARVGGASGEKPHGVFVSPDNSQLAVAYPFAGKIQVLSTSNLTTLYSPDTSGLKFVASAAWSVDGEELIAGASYGPEPALNAVFKWTDRGRGRRTELRRADGRVGVSVLRSGRLLFGTENASFGVWNGEGQVLWSHEAPIAQYSSTFNPLVVSATGVDVQFSYGPTGTSWASFLGAWRQLVDGRTARDGTAHGPTTAGLNITTWNTPGELPRLNGVPLKLANAVEQSQSIAIFPDRRQFLLGTEWYLRAIDASGLQRWRVSTPGGAKSVNVSSDGRLAICGLGDGTIRWYRAQDGRELMALYPHPDRKLWVAWTPSGYYDASPGGENLVGWHLNNGKNAAADFFPISRFRSTYYRPDVVERVLQTLDEGDALRLANAEAGRRNSAAEVARLAPPVVTLLSPADHSVIGTRDITIRYDIRTPSGEPITLVRVLVDGRPVGTPRRLVAEDASSVGREARISIPERDCAISIIAENRYAASEPATIHVIWKGAQRAATQANLYLLAIGISNYPEKFRLQWASKDAQDFATAMEHQKGVLYRDVQVRLLRDEAATRDGILDGLEWLEKNTTQSDVGMLFLSGHGWNDPGGTYYFIPANFAADRVRSTAVPSAEVQKTVQSMAGKIVVFLDTCFSGNVLGGRAGEPGADINRVANELVSAENGAVVFTASSGRQVALERPEWGNGAFTKALMEGLNGKADMMGKGTITVNALDYYISERVKELTENQQTPTTAKPQTIADFAIALRRN